MSNLNKILRDSRILIDSAKDVVTTNIVEARSKGVIGMDDKQLQTLLDIVTLSIDESYQKSTHVFQNMVKRHIES